MIFINWIKVLAIWLCDTINRCYDPFEENNIWPETGTFADLSINFEKNLDTTFMLPSGEFLYQQPRPEDSGDTALWQGICTGMKILRNGRAPAQMAFLDRLFVKSALVRGFFPTGEANDTTSNDSATGPLFAFYCAQRFGDSQTQSRAGAILVAWAKNLRYNNWALVDQNGKPTKYGKLEDGILTDPLRITLLLAIVALASTYDPSFDTDYQKLYAKYRPILAYPKVSLLWLDTSYDTHRAAINLHVLYWLTKDKVYKAGLKRLYRITSKTLNAWAKVLCWEALDKPDVKEVARILKTFDFEARQRGNVESLHPEWPSVRWGGKDRAKKALPFCYRGSQDFFWQRHPFSKDEWVGNKTADVFHSGLDYLVCFWLARRLSVDY